MQDSLLEIFLKPRGQIIGRRKHTQDGTGHAVDKRHLVEFPDGLVSISAGSGVGGTVHLFQEFFIQPAGKIGLVIAVFVHD
jgi:hypothetical protein